MLSIPAHIAHNIKLDFLSKCVFVKLNVGVPYFRLKEINLSYNQIKRFEFDSLSPLYQVRHTKSPGFAILKVGSFDDAHP